MTTPLHHRYVVRFDDGDEVDDLSLDELRHPLEVAPASAEAAPDHSGAVTRAPMLAADACIPNARCEVFFDDLGAWFGGVIVSSHAQRSYAEPPQAALTLVRSGLRGNLHVRLCDVVADTASGGTLGFVHFDAAVNARCVFGFGGNERLMCVVTLPCLCCCREDVVFMADRPGVLNGVHRGSKHVGNVLSSDKEMKVSGCVVCVSWMCGGVLGDRACCMWVEGVFGDWRFDVSLCDRC